MIDLAILLFLIFSFAGYCIYLKKKHKKSPLFTAGIVWFILNIICVAITIFWSEGIDFVKPMYLHVYMNWGMKIINTLRIMRCCSVIAMAVCFYCSQKEKQVKA